MRAVNKDYASRLTAHAANPRKGRGALSNVDGRFEPYQHERVDDGWAPQQQPESTFKTHVTVDASKTILARNQSPDVPFEQSVNPYRGCEHGCVYCFARPTHAYLGWSAGLDFETRLLVKPNAPGLLREEISRSNYRCRVLALGTNTDPYQPIERRYRLMRGILELLAACNHPLCITTKSSLVERDLDLLAPLAGRCLVSVSISLTTLDHQLARRMEPRATAPRRRLEAIRRLAAAGVPVNVSVAPVVPALTDAEMETVIAAAADAGAVSASYILLRLPREVNALFQEWLAAHYPQKAAHVMSIVRQCRGGKDYDADFGTRKRGTGIFADMIAQRFAAATERHGLQRSLPPLTCELFTRPPSADPQLQLL